MKISSIKNIEITKKQPAFCAGVTNFYSDFDGTFLPYKYRHDTFCRFDGIGPREEFLKTGKELFQEYFDNFNNFIQTAKGKKKNKFNFTITSGRNRPEYNYVIKRIRMDGLSLPVPDRLIIRNGGDIYKKRSDIGDFFKSDADELFLKQDFVQQKRTKVKSMTGGWDGDKIRKTIKEYFGRLTGNHKKITVFEAGTDGVFYEEGMHFIDKLKKMKPKPEDYAVIKENGNLNFQVLLPVHLSSGGMLKIAEETLNEKLKESGVFISLKNNIKKMEETFGQIELSPKINGKKIDKLFDTKEEVQKIIKNKSNNLVIAAGDGINDVRMLNLFEYIKEGEDSYGFSAENLKKIYNLPLITIFVDNSKQKGKEVLHSSTLNIPFDKIDNYFNSDGNVRFIHVLPENKAGKPQNLNEAIELAIKEYAKRNKKYRKKLPKKLLELIENKNISYPIDKTVSESLEEELKVKLWNPAPDLTKTSNNKVLNFFDKKTNVLLLCAGAVLTAGIIVFNNIKNKNKKREQAISPALNNIISANFLKSLNKKREKNENISGFFI